MSQCRWPVEECHIGLSLMALFILAKDKSEVAELFCLTNFGGVLCILFIQEENLSQH